MKEKTYHRMTKKRPLRGFKLFKQKYITKQRFYALLAKFRLVREVKSESFSPYRKSEVLNKVQVLEHKIKTDRGVFNLSYQAEGKSVDCKWWYESLFRKKRLYTIVDNLEYHLSVQVQSECEEFLVKITPFCSATVTRKTPCVQVFAPVVPFSPITDISTIEDVNTVKKINCNFLNARVRVALTVVVPTEEEIDDGIRELINKATAQIRNYVDGNPDKINEVLTGVPFDGEFHTKEGKKLIPNCVCRRCSRPVFESSVEGYSAQCLFCDEDLYDMEVRKIDPELYKDIYEISKLQLFQILTK